MSDENKIPMVEDDPLQKSPAVSQQTQVADQATQTVPQPAQTAQQAAQPQGADAQQPTAQSGDSSTKKPIYKRVWFWVVVVIVVFAVIGVADDDSEESDDVQDSEVTSVEEAEEESDVDTGEAVDEEAAEEEAVEEEESFKKIVLYDDDGIKVTITDVLDDWLSAGYTVKIVNNSSRSIDVDIDDVSVDGIMVDTFFYESVAAGKTAIEDLDLYDSDVIGSSDDLKNVEGSLFIYDDSFNTIVDTTFTIK